MVAHMSLDSVEEIMEGTGALYAHSPLSTNLVEVIADAHVCRYLKGVDRYNEWIVSAFIPTGGESFTQHTLGRLPLAETGHGVKFVLLHDIKNDDGIRLFFIDLWEAYIKVSKR